MANQKKLLLRLLRGGSDGNFRFSDLCGLLLHLGFQVRIRGSHHLFVKSGVETLINLQKDGDGAKPYQVRQVRQVLTQYGIGSDE